MIIKLEVTISNDAASKNLTEQRWGITLLFRNYSSFNQINNAGKSVHGELIFQSKGCVKNK